MTGGIFAKVNTEVTDFEEGFSTNIDIRAKMVQFTQTKPFKKWDLTPRESKLKEGVLFSRFRRS